MSKVRSYLEKLIDFFFHHLCYFVLFDMSPKILKRKWFYEQKEKAFFAHFLVIGCLFFIWTTEHVICHGLTWHALYCLTSARHRHCILWQAKPWNWYHDNVFYYSQYVFWLLKNWIIGNALGFTVVSLSMQACLIACFESISTNRRN